MSQVIPNSNIYFTILHQTNNAGFTDQLLQFSTFYKLGLALEYKYVHTSFTSTRSSERIYDFLGFNTYWKLHISNYHFVNCHFIELGIEDKLLEEQEINKLTRLKKWIHDFVLDSFQKNKLNCKKVVVVRFRLIGSRSFFKLINSSITDFPDHLIPRDIYLSARKQYPRASRFISGTIKLLVHIRQGDTTILETPWNTFIPLKGKRKLQEVNNLALSGIPHIKVREYYNFIKQLIKQFEENFFSVVVSSDGYKRAVEKVYNDREKFDWTSKQVTDFYNFYTLYDESQFRIFNDISNSICLIGEEDENLYDLIHSALTANIIVVSNQQRMMLKLLSFFHDQRKMPLVIILYKGKSPNLTQDLSLSPETANIVTVNVNKFDINNIADEITKIGLARKAI